jgi:hypothetical protein
MFIAGHVAAGALIGQTLGFTNPALVVALSFASHFLLDVIPHGDGHHVADYYQGKKEKLKALYSGLAVDTSVSIIMVAFLLGFTTFDRVHMAWGIIASVIPDFFVGMNELYNHKFFKWFTRMHFKVHNAFIHKLHVPAWPGAILQILLIVGMLAAL